LSMIRLLLGSTQELQRYESGGGESE
jgi:hypothetical protein